ncbi:MAG: hypothetical protein CM15mP68_0440 [Pseudomonadota bacterium]|nr:MAG: hypothetical protein CM15mP68_0440 [Pseudomonadota bacterium]
MRGSVNSSRQNLQVEYVERLAAIWQGKAAKNFSHLARSAVLAQLQQLAKRLKSKRRGDAQQRPTPVICCLSFSVLYQ